MLVQILKDLLEIDDAGHLMLLNFVAVDTGLQQLLLRLQAGDCRGRLKLVSQIFSGGYRNLTLHPGVDATTKSEGSFLVEANHERRLCFIGCSTIANSDQR